MLYLWCIKERKREKWGIIIERRETLEIKVSLLSHILLDAAQLWLIVQISAVSGFRIPDILVRFSAPPSPYTTKFYDMFRERVCAQCSAHGIIVCMYMTYFEKNYYSWRKETSSWRDCPTRFTTVANANTLWHVLFEAFSFVGPSIWNSLSTDLTSCETVSTFKRRLKTHHFRSVFCPQL